MITAMATIHISEAEAARDLHGLLARVRAGAEVIITNTDLAAPVILRTAPEPHLRLLSESLRLAREHASTAILDGEFGRDLEAVINSHPEPLANPWD